MQETGDLSQGTSFTKFTAPRTAPRIDVDLNKPAIMIALSIVAGLAGGVITYWAQGVLPPWLSLWANSTPPWFTFAVVAGLFSARFWLAPITGVLTQWCLVFGYYQISDVSYQWWDRLDVIWLASGVASGVVGGIIGWGCRSDNTAIRTFLTCALPAIFISEGVEYALRTDAHYEGTNVPNGLIMAFAGLLIAIAFPGTGRERLLRIPITIALSAIAMIIVNWLVSPLLQSWFLAR